MSRCSPRSIAEFASPLRVTLLRALFDKVNVGKHEDGFVALVDDFALFVNKTVLRALRIFLLILYRDGDAYRVADEDRLDETQSIVAVTEGYRIDFAGCHAYSDGEYQRPMGHALAEGLGLYPLGVHVVRVEVSGVTGVDHDVGLGNRAPGGHTCFTELVVFEVSRIVHLNSFL